MNSIVKATAANIGGKEFKVDEEFRHSGGTWKVTNIYPEWNCIDIAPTYGTKIKPGIVGRVFKINGVWFKVAEQGNNYITLVLKLTL